ncbi:MAG: T9SS type A sorting domain-containing protein [Flavobacterium sp.]
MNKALFTLLFFPFLALSQNGCWNDIYSGRANSVFLKNDGSTWMTGQNVNGQLGVGNNTNSNQLINLNISGFVKFALGDYHVLAIKSDGTLWGWGQNNLGQLGDGTLVDKNLPVQIGTDNNWIEISTGRRHSTAIKSNGTLWAWGYNVDGSLGVGNTNEYLMPIQVGTDTNWSKISMGYYHSIAIKTNGTLWAWGWNDFGQIGDGTFSPEGFKTSPIQIGTDQTWFMVKGGNAHTIALKNDGTLWGWGWNAFGQLGDSTTIDRLLPVQIGNSTNWTSISVGLGHTLALNSNGNIFSCGLNNAGQLGQGTINSDPNSSLTQISLSNSIIKISCGSHFCNIIDSNNNVISFGSNISGQFGNGNNTSNITPSNYVDCSTLSIDYFETNPQSIKIFPNPSKNYITIQQKNELIENYNFMIIDLFGRVVKKGNSKLNEHINIETLANGNYIIQIETDKGEKLIEKLVKN